LLSITLSSRFILCATLHLRRLAPTNVVVGVMKGDECPCPLVFITVRGFSSPSSVSSSSYNGVGYREKCLKYNSKKIYQ
jgi:hypothetical protein